MSLRTVVLGFGILVVLFLFAVITDIFHWSTWVAFWPTIITEISFFISWGYDLAKEPEDHISYP